MKVLTPGTDLDGFFSHVQRARHRVLLTDYDGTLAPFRREREQAVPYPDVRRILEQAISTNLCRVIIVTGRAIDVVMPLMGLPRLPEIWGSHGWERRFPDGRYELMPMSESQIVALDTAARELTQAGFTEECERKPASVALHTRVLSDHDAQMALTEGRRILSRFETLREVVLTEFDGGIELRAVGRTKGNAIKTILSEFGVSDGRRAGTEDVAFCYLGDDRTDEDAFLALHGHGLCVLVREEFRETAADLWIRPPGELIVFLARWMAACTNPPAS